MKVSRVKSLEFRSGFAIAVASVVGVATARMAEVESKAAVVTGEEAPVGFTSPRVKVAGSGWVAAGPDGSAVKAGKDPPSG